MKRNKETPVSDTVETKKEHRLLKKVWEKLKPKSVKGWIVRGIILFVLIFLTVQIVKIVKVTKQVTDYLTAHTDETAQYRTISSKLEGSGSVQPIDTYEIKSKVEGDVISVNFNVGDMVEKDQVLIQLTTEDAEKGVKNARQALERAKRNYEKQMDSVSSAEDAYERAVKNYDRANEDFIEAEARYGTTSLVSDVKGYITKIYVREGDTIREEQDICDVEDDSTMILEINFTASEVSQATVGKKALVEVEGTFETLPGKVTYVSNKAMVGSGNVMTKKVKIEVENPGGIVKGTGASASIGDIYCNEPGAFVIGQEKTVKAKMGGDIDYLFLEEGNAIKPGDVMMIFDRESTDDMVDSYEEKLNNAWNARYNAKNNLDNCNDKIDDYEDQIEDLEEELADKEELLEDCSIKAPVAGQMIAKEVEPDDEITLQNMNYYLAILYDVSKMTFDMSIDELDIRAVQIGQRVVVEADALDGSLEGHVTNIDLQSKSNGGVTTYTVTVTIDDPGELLPSMNVTGTILLADEENVLAVPIDAVRNGSVVYVKDDSVTEAVGNVPAGYRSVEVETGVTDGKYIEIKSGITEGETVYVARYNSTGKTDNPWAALMGEGGGTGFEVSGPSGGPSGGRPDGDGRGSGSRDSGGSGGFAGR